MARCSARKSWALSGLPHPRESPTSQTNHQNLGSGRLFEGVGAIAHHLVPGTRSVARIAQVQYPRHQPVAACGLQQTLYRDAPAGILIMDVLGSQLGDGLGGRLIEPLSGEIVMVVTQIRADDEAGLS